MTGRTVTLTPLRGFPEVREGEDVAGLTLEALQHNGIELMDGDVLVVSSKVVSKAMGLRAPAAERAGVVLSQTVRVVAERMTPSGVARVVESAAGPVMAAAGVDASNTADESIVLVLPDDPDAVAAEIRRDVQAGWATLSGARVRVGLVLSDTAGRPWRIGQVDFALGAAGIHLVDDLRGSTDADGRILSVTERCVADEIAAAADLVKGKATGIPVAHIRGLGRYVQDGEPTSGARDLVRTGPQDWFGYGAVEAVRAALGVEPGSSTAIEIGIPSIDPEDLPTRAGRALRVALMTCPQVSGHVEDDTIRLLAVDDFALGVAATRAEVALRAEGLTATLTRTSAPPLATGEMLTAQPGAVIVFSSRSFNSGGSHDHPGLSCHPSPRA
jgi:coenzyme F420-0:L-glutamate ligase/coenzyme F420-1:gamma-L-glutamate ligase